MYRKRMLIVALSMYIINAHVFSGQFLGEFNAIQKEATSGFELARQAKSINDLGQFNAARQQLLKTAATMNAFMNKFSSELRDDPDYAFVVKVAELQNQLERFRTTGELPIQ